MPVSKTADGSYKYSHDFYGHKLSDLAQEAHKHLSKSSGWFYRALVPGQFGYDNMIMSVAVAIDETPENPTQQDLAALVHEGWCRNYNYWRDRKPWDLQKGYKKPSKPLGDKRRDSCAKTKFSKLDPEEQEKDLVIARYLMSVIDLFEEESVNDELDDLEAEFEKAFG